MVVLANPASSGASRRVLCVSRSGFKGCGIEVARSRAIRMGIRGCRWHEAVQGTVPGVAVSRRCMFHSVGHGGAVAGMVAQGRWWRRWPLPLAWRHSAVPCGRRVVVHHPFEGSAILFRGCGAPAVQEWVVQCRGAVADHAAQRRTVAGMAAPRELAEQCGAWFLGA
jgi:hypothetical protein